MKIGVLTLSLHNNFGGILQAYALQLVLNNLGHDAVLIDKSKYVSLRPWYKKYSIYLKRAVQKYLMQKDTIIRADVEQNRITKVISTEEALKDAEPMEWPEEVLSGKTKVIITRRK